MESLYNLAIIRHSSGKKLSRRQVMRDHEFFKQFRVVLFRKEIFINDKSRFPFVFASCGFDDTIKSLNLINEYCGDDKILCHGGYDSFKKKYYNNVDVLKHHFKKVFFEHYKYNDDYIKVLPQAFNYRYLKTFNKKIFGDLVDSSFNVQKDKLIGTAFGKRWPKLSKRLIDRISLLEAIEHSGLIENFYCDVSEYHLEKSRYLYFACPRGAGLQSTKLYESFMCETVPILTDAPYARQLRDYHNLPILIVDNWENISVDYLIEIYEKNYKNYDWKSLKRKFYIDNFIDEFIIKNN